MQKSPEQLVFDPSNYMDILKKDAIYFKMESSEVLYKNTLEIEDIWQFLRNLTTSYSNYVKVKFHQKFANLFQDDPKRIDKALQKLMQYSKLRLVDLKFDSFAFGVSADTMMGNEKIDIPEISNWRKSLLSDFQKEVVEFDLKSKKAIENLTKNFSKEERRAIFEPIIKSINRDEFSISILDADFIAKNSYSKIPQSTIQAIIPVEEKVIQSPKIEMMEIIVPVDKSKSKITIRTKEIENDLFAQPKNEFSKKVDYLATEDQRVTLKKAIEFKVKQDAESGEFLILFAPLNLEIRTADFGKIKEEFFKAMWTHFEYYKRLVSKQRTLTESEQAIVKFFKSVVSLKKS